jgi:hypothetical protein
MHPGLADEEGGGLVKLVWVFLSMFHGSIICMTMEREVRTRTR